MKSFSRSRLTGKHLVWVMAAAMMLGSVSVPGVALAKLPPPSEEAKAKAEENKAKAAATAEADQKALAKAEDRAAERYIKEQKAKGVVVKPTPIAAAPAPAAVAAKPAAAAAKPAAAPSGDKKK